jgi:hypothetical protein
MKEKPDFNLNIKYLLTIFYQDFQDYKQIYDLFELKKEELNSFIETSIFVLNNLILFRAFNQKDKNIKIEYLLIFYNIKTLLIEKFLKLLLEIIEFQEKKDYFWKPKLILFLSFLKKNIFLLEEKENLFNQNLVFNILCKYIKSDTNNLKSLFSSKEEELKLNFQDFHLQNIEIKVVGDDEILCVSDNDLQAELLNHTFKTNKTFFHFLISLFDKEYKIYFISRQKWKEFGKTFRFLKKINYLNLYQSYQKKQASLSRIKEEKKKEVKSDETETYKIAKKIFNQIIIE